MSVTVTLQLVKAAIIERIPIEDRKGTPKVITAANQNKRR